MPATSVTDQQQTTERQPPPPPPARSWQRARSDIVNGIRQRELWAHLGWQDIKQRYRRSTLGPFWITLSMAITGTGLGLLYSQLFGLPLGTFLPYLTVGLMVWNFIIGCVTEGCGTFISNAGLISHLPAPRTVFAMRVVWRQTLYFSHNILVYVLILIFFGSELVGQYKTTPGLEAAVLQPGLSWELVFAIPAFALLALNGVWVALLFGIISTRYRDIPQVVNSLTSLLFFMTPIIWSVDVLHSRFKDGVGWRMLIAELNPLYHYVQILRAPLIGHAQSWHHWAVVGGFTVLGWCLALVAMRNYRARVSYWV